jgi:RNA polymerase sigma-70 factor (ECF subfamily)
MSKSPPSGQAKSGRGRFPTTSWTLIQKVQKGTAADASRAMEEICHAYWYAIYAFARRYGFSPHDAEDLTQVFFQNLIKRETIQAARAEEGRLRTFMLAMLRQIIAKQFRHDATDKRGGKGRLISIDEVLAEELYAHEPRDISDPGLLFDRAWAEGVLAAAAAKLQAEYVKADNEETFLQLREFLPLGENATPYADAAAKLGLREATLRLQIHRMRKRYGQLISAEIAQTVEGDAEQKAERDYLMAVIGQ